MRSPDDPGDILKRKGGAEGGGWGGKGVETRGVWKQDELQSLSVKLEGEKKTARSRPTEEEDTKKLNIPVNQTSGPVYERCGSLTVARQTDEVLP